MPTAVKTLTHCHGWKRAVETRNCASAGFRRTKSSVPLRMCSTTVDEARVDGPLEHALEEREPADDHERLAEAPAGDGRAGCGRRRRAARWPGHPEDLDEPVEQEVGAVLQREEQRRAELHAEEAERTARPVSLRTRRSAAGRAARAPTSPRGAMATHIHCRARSTSACARRRARRSSARRAGRSGSGRGASRRPRGRRAGRGRSGMR